MDQRRLYRTIESFAAENVRSERELLKHVLRQIVNSDKITLQGGRVWQYESASRSYRLIYQTGVIERLDQGYRISVASYPTFLRVGNERSIIAKETDRYLKKKGITTYSVTGIGDRIPFGKTSIYQYLLAFNSETLDAELLSELNIISLAVSSLLSRMKMERRATQLAKDIDRAREIQQSILPESSLQFHHYDIYGISVPDRIVGGDFFDYLHGDQDSDRLSIVVGDAASKGLKAAAQAMYVSGALRMGVSMALKIPLLMSRVNTLLQQTFSEEHFISMFYAEFLNDRKGLMLYANAGHNSPMLYRAKERGIELLEATGQILGPFPHERYRVENTHIHPNDVLVIYTDGITEARNSAGDQYGEKRLAQRLERLHRHSAEQICRDLLAHVTRFAKGVDDGDDKTIVVVKRVQ